MDAMKRTLISVAAAFAVASTSAVAQGVKMSDEQLDQITAAGAVSIVIISNSGNASVGNLAGDRHLTCINCADLAPVPTVEGARTNGAVLVANRKFPEGAPVRCIGGGVTVLGFGAVC